jgi:hypothetical protein
MYYVSEPKHDLRAAKGIIMSCLKKIKNVLYLFVSFFVLSFLRCQYGQISNKRSLKRWKHLQYQLYLIGVCFGDSMELLYFLKAF